MNNSYCKKIISALLIIIMILSNAAIPTEAADISYETVEENANVEQTEQTETEVADSGESVLPEAEASSVQQTASLKETEENADPYAEEQNYSDTAMVQSVVSGKFRISGSIEFNEKLNGTDWQELVRPSEFDQPIKIMQSYTDSKGVQQTVVFDTQEDLSRNDFYLKFAHDGEGAGDFVIENVPKSITDAYGEECQITACTVNIAPVLPYYESKTPITVDMSNPAELSTALGTLTLNLKYQTLTLKTEILPESRASDTSSFIMKTVFTNPALTDEADKDRKLEISYRPTVQTSTIAEVPLGLAYTVVQQPADGYRLNNQYSTITTKDGVSSDPAFSEASAKGTIAENEDVTISTINYAQNISVGFDINWIDNNKTNRPSLSEDNFVLQFKTADGQWTDLTAEQYEHLNLSVAPKFDTSKAVLYQYAYTGLSAADIDGNALEYRVLVKKAPDQYVSDYTDDPETGRRTFDFEEQTTFSAEIVWNDISGPDVHRPSGIDCLKLYRRTGNGDYELVYGELPKDAIEVNGDTWTVNISNIPLYNRQNQEYDYVLVQGSIDGKTVSQEPLNDYKTYYTNGSGSYGNDISLCHNGGRITEVLYDEMDFRAAKIWKDPEGQIEDRPTSAVTLWRYIKDAASDIDDAYNRGLATQVVFQTNNNGQTIENIISYQLDKTKGTTEAPLDISFDSKTVANMPENYQLPLYDDHGQEYVYFVRESLTGAHADDFAVQYTGTDADGNARTYKNGAPAGGTITNVRREKAAVTVTKLWQNPSGLEEIDGASVNVQIMASADQGQTYDKLTVYSSTSKSYDVLTDEDDLKKAQTITGFTSSLGQNEITYYVDIYNNEGEPYDMSTARIEESVQKGSVVYNTAEDADGNTVININGHIYRVKTSADTQNPSVLGDGTKQYRYQQTNTISGNREYTLIKEWADTIPDDMISDIEGINFKLERRSTKDKADGTPADYEEVTNGSGKNIWSVVRQDARTWTSVLTHLPKYDENGYEYIYRATEISYTDVNGKTIPISQRTEWVSEHYQTPDQTKVINRSKGTSGGYFNVSKNWQDNGDSVSTDESRKNVQIRVYRRSDLKTALETWKKAHSGSDDAIVDLDALTGLKHFDATLTLQDQYTKDIYYTDLEKTIDGKAWDSSQSDTCSNYIVLEYCVGEQKDGAAAAQYSYAQLSAAAEGSTGYTMAGTVENSLRQYHVRISLDSNNERLVLLTNTRTGTTEIQAVKNWHDEENINNLRPTSVSFQLYQDGTAYTDIPASVSVSADDDKTCTVSLNDATGVITVTAAEPNTASCWSFKVTGLDMFSSTSIPHTYNLDEIASDNETANTYRYILKKAVPTVADTNIAQTYTFAFDNTITGTKSHIAYKYWQDSGIGSGNRPDLYMNLYRYLKKDQRENPDTDIMKLPSCQLYTAYKDQIWTVPSDSSSHQEYEKNYNWKITVNDLPQFDENGNEYGYIFTEKMNNNGVTVLGTYQPSVETKTIPSNTADADTYEMFKNTISGYMTVQGKKTWTGLAGYQTKEDALPDPLISLYRTTDDEITELQSLTENEIKALINNGKITLVDMTHLTDNAAASKSQYSFPDADITQEELDKGLICKVDGKAMLPKFDAEGRRYKYLIRENITDPIASQLYSQITANDTLSNVFRQDLNRRTITVTKTWEQRGDLQDKEQQYPSVTYTLYRYEAGKPENETLIKIETHTIDSDAFTGQSGQASYTFKNLLIYSPTGVQYCYYIEEKAISGYSIHYTDEAGICNKSLKDSELSIGQNADGTTDTLKVTDEMLTSLQNNKRIDVISLPAKWNDPEASPAELDTAVSTVNVYDQKGNIKISGEKKWDDYSNLEGLRPQSIQVTLTRHTNNESGQHNKVDSVVIALPEKESEDPAVTTPYIVWDKGENALTSDTWKYTIYNLERYAPNGMPYIYTLSEGKTEGYQQANAVSVQANADTLTMGTITNCFSGSYYVRKNWMDGNNKYNLRPKEITVKLQRKTEDTDWQDIVLPDNSILSETLNTSHVIKNTKNNSWEYTFTNLPTQNKAGRAYQYRCVETAIGDVPINEETQEDGTMKYAAGAYECRYTTQNQSKTILENTLDATSLVVTKNWEGDQNNLYQSRPDHLTFVLQKRSVKIADENDETEDSAQKDGDDEESLSEWEDVLRADGTPYTFTISPNASGVWTKTLEDLPTAEVHADEHYTVYSLYFRAVEVHASLGKDTADGAQNYQDVTNYAISDDNTSHRYIDGHNESTITNQLILDKPARSITVTKVWRRTKGADVQAVFELLYKTKGETNWHCYSKQTIEKADGSDTEITSGTDWTKHTSEAGCQLQTSASSDAGTSDIIQWTDLPKYDLNGSELDYKVIEHPINGYASECAITNENNNTKYTFTNIELQSYTVKKIWQNTSDAEKSDKGYTAVFQLQQKTADGEWTDAARDPVTLTSSNPGDKTQSYTWQNLPEYTVDGKEILYRAVETRINDQEVKNNTNGAYNVSYSYSGKTEPAFKDSETVAVNRMIYGFVNMSKSAAYLAPEVTETGKLEGVEFNIYKTDAAAGNAVLYVSDVETDANGNLKNTAGKYGKEQKYLPVGNYLLKEASSGEDYSIWDQGIAFTIGTGEKQLTGTLKDTGEHGTAWISTSKTPLTGNLHLSVSYLPPDDAAEHTFADACTAHTDNSSAVNLESRGVLNFTKTGPKTNGIYTALDTHEGASGESQAYFGVYLDPACTRQVAGMKPSDTDKTLMVLTNQMLDGTSLDEKDQNGVPYLRSFRNDTYPEYPFTLLSGIYYIKELKAPAGYKLDQTIRRAVIAKLDETTLDKNLSGVYSENKAEIATSLGSAGGFESGTTVYQWSNQPNCVIIYKMDQYGRKVPLKDNGYLELKIESDGKTFPSNASVIKLYQNADTSALTDNNQKADQITYDAQSGAWVITGLLDVGTTYTLSEPDESVHDNYIIAKPIHFTVDASGNMHLANGHENDALLTDTPLKADGTNYSNSCQSNSDHNQLVLRDVSRYLKDAALKKQDSVTNQAIANISFRLYKYDSKNTDGTLAEKKDVLEKDIYLTTDQNGKIDLEKLDSSIKNQITGCALKYGLDIGHYYFEEVERGASDGYRLADPIFFDIVRNTDGKAEDYHDYADVNYTTNAYVSVDASDAQTVIVKNDPVTTKSKTLELKKVDSENRQIVLANAKFVLSYQSVTNGDSGSMTGGQKNVIIWNCATNAEGVLYLTDSAGTITNKKPDISGKGSYTLKEIQAPEGYMTRTDPGSSEAVIMAAFDVNSDNQIVNVQKDSDAKDLVLEASVSSDEDGENTTLNLTIANEKTKVSIAKKNDIEGSNSLTDTKTCNPFSLNGELLSGAKLEIYEGTEINDNAKRAVLGNNQNTWNWISAEGGGVNTHSELPAGTLTEDTVYTLHESQTPVGYMSADDIYFKLSGTTLQNNITVSQLYVWTGRTKPTSADGDEWQKSSQLQDDVLTMVDEAIIAPIDTQKVVGNNNTYAILPGAVFDVKAGNAFLGTAKSSENGYLVWETISDQPNEGYQTALIFNEAGKRVSSKDASTVIGKTIILQQNAVGYTLTETDAPDTAYNEGKSFAVNITAEHYRQYKKAAASDGYPAAYDTTSYVDIQTSKWFHRNVVTNAASASDLVNPGFETHFQLYKYDAENAAVNADHNNYDQIGMKGVVFTLSKQQQDGTYQKVGEYTTAASGLLAIDIAEKGTYQLRETKTLTGYVINSKVMTFTIANSDYQKTLTYSEDDVSHPNHTAVIKNADGTQVAGSSCYDLPNSRQHGKIVLNKRDADSEEALSGVIYTLTRISPDYNANVDHYFPSKGASALSVTTGKTYSNIAGAKTVDEIQIADGDAGSLVLNDLQWGTYMLTENTELSGYKLEKDADGKIIHTHTLTIGPGEGEWKNSQLTYTLTDTNAKNSITFYKSNQVDPEADVSQKDIKPLAGAVFEVHEGDTCHTNGDGSSTCSITSFYIDSKVSADGQKVSTVTTDENGKVTIYGLPTNTGSDTPKTYHLVEIRAPKGYKLQTEPIVFTIDRQGKVQIKNQDNNVFADADPSGQVAMMNEPIKIYIRKTGEDGTTGLKGGEFLLKDTCQDGEAKCDHKLANGSSEESVRITSEDGKILIPIERLIGGHTYTLTETKAPDGYESTAVVTFHVKIDGTIDSIHSSGGYTGADGTGSCASVDADKKTICIMNEKVRMTLTKVDSSNTAVTLKDVVFTLIPYGTVDDGPNKGQSSTFAEDYDMTGLQYDKNTNTCTFMTNDNGTIDFPEGLLKHNNTYLLREQKTGSDYYLGKEAESGVILHVGKDGGITLERLPEYKGKTMTSNGKTVDSCPVGVLTGSAGVSDLIAQNTKAASFELTKMVAGNMGDLNGSFRIKMEVYEPDGTKIGERTVNLKANESYDSETGLTVQGETGLQAFGPAAIPVGAVLVIKEDNDKNYTAEVEITGGTVLSDASADKGTVRVRLESTEKISIKLTNKKEIAIDVGVHTDRQTPLAVVALLIPTAWLAYRRRKKYKGGTV